MDAMGLYHTGWDTDTKGDIVRQYETLPYSRLISRGANVRVFRESGQIRENFLPRKFSCSLKVTRERDRVSF